MLDPSQPQAVAPLPTQHLGASIHPHRLSIHLPCRTAGGCSPVVSMAPGLILGQPSLLSAQNAWEAQEVARLQVEARALACLTLPLLMLLVLLADFIR